MKKYIPILIPLIILLIGAGIIAYPFIVTEVNDSTQRSVIYDVRAVLENTDSGELAAYWDEARAYNDALAGLAAVVESDTAVEAPTEDRYNEILSFANGIMGYIEIPKIKVELPIYHGTTDEVLAKGVGHLYGSSLPIGGEGTHSVLTSHSGLSSATLFTELDQLVAGDVFYITILDKTFAYTVEDINVVEPHQVETLVPEPGRDLVTLITCYPVTVNTHRLLVRGARATQLEDNDEIIETTNTGTTGNVVTAQDAYNTISRDPETIFSEYIEETQHERDRKMVMYMLVFATCLGIFLVIVLAVTFFPKKGATNDKNSKNNVRTYDIIPADWGMDPIEACPREEEHGSEE